ncbi:MAG: helix-turn-helix domain-containing protein [Nevskia sp.]|nr:helix-turn-helix domain-containing protein [Nevskia sp.]
MENYKKVLIRGLLNGYYWMDESIQNHIRAAGYEPLSRSQAMIMINVAGGVRRPSDLARNLGVSRQAVHQLLADMDERGLIDLRPDPADARAKEVHFSRRGSGMHMVAVEAQRKVQQELERRLGKKVIEDLTRTLLDLDWGAPVQPKATSRKATPQRQTA